MIFFGITIAALVVVCFLCVDGGLGISIYMLFGGLKCLLEFDAINFYFESDSAVSFLS